MSLIRFFLTVFIFLLSSCADTKCDKGNEALCVEKLVEASKKGNKNDLKQILANGISVNSKNNRGLTPLEASLINNQTEIFEILLKEGADPASAISGTEIPLIFMAINPDNFNHLSLLLEYGADVNSDLKVYGTPLIVAARGGYFKQVLYLLEQGANPNLGMKNGRTIYSYLCVHMDRLGKNNLDLNKVLSYLEKMYHNINNQEC